MLAAEHVHDAAGADAALQGDQAARAFGHLADARRLRGDRQPLQNLDDAAACACRHERREAAFVGHVERVEAQDLAGARARPRAPGLLASSMRIAHAARSGDLVQRAGQAAARQVAQAVHLDRRRRAAPAPAPPAGPQSLSMGASNSSPSRTAMIAMPWRPRSPLSRMASPGCTDCGRDLEPVLDHADARRVDEQPSPLPLSTTLVSPVTSCTPARRGRLAASRPRSATASPSASPSSRMNPALR